MLMSVVQVHLSPPNLRPQPFWAGVFSFVLPQTGANSCERLRTALHTRQALAGPDFSLLCRILCDLSQSRKPCGPEVVKNLFSKFNRLLYVESSWFYFGSGRRTEIQTAGCKTLVVKNHRLEVLADESSISLCTTISRGLNVFTLIPSCLYSPVVAGCSPMGLRTVSPQNHQISAQNPDFSLFSTKACGLPARSSLSTVRVCGEWFYLLRPRA